MAKKTSKRSGGGKSKKKVGKKTSKKPAANRSGGGDTSLSDIGMDVRKVGISVTMAIAKLIVGWKVVREKSENSIPFIDENGNAGFAELSRNQANRKFDLKLARRYGQVMYEGRWAGQRNHPASTGNGESWLVDNRNRVISCVHRCVGLIFAEYQRLWDQKLAKELYGWKDEITLPNIVIINSIDPRAADTADTAKARTLADVFYRRREFPDVNPTQLKKLCQMLAVGVHLVWIRTTGKRIRKGPKWDHQDAVEFLDRHPLLRKCAEYVFNRDSERDISSYIKPGYAVGLLYLFATSGVSENKQKEVFEGGSITKVPHSGRWKLAEEFFNKIAGAKEAGKKVTGETLFHAWDVFNDIRNGEFAPDRDGQCTILCRAWNNFCDRQENPKLDELAKKKLKWALVNTAGKDDFEADFVRVGGLDVEIDEEEIETAEEDAEEEDAGGVMEIDESNVEVIDEGDDLPAAGGVAMEAGDYKVGDRVWVQREEDTNMWCGQIVELGKDGVVWLDKVDLDTGGLISEEYESADIDEIQGKVVDTPTV